MKTIFLTVDIKNLEDLDCDWNNQEEADYFFREIRRDVHNAISDRLGIKRDSVEVEGMIKG